MVYSQPAHRLEEYNFSLATWKKLNPKFYQYVTGEYTIDFDPVSRTTITVKNGKVIKRHYWSKDPWERRYPVITWVEDTPETLGTHSEGFPPIDLDEVYIQCRSNILIHEPEMIQFEIKNNNIISRCGIHLTLCSDGCFEGVHIESITVFS